MGIGKLLEYCAKYEELYCYGAGRFGREVSIYLMEKGVPVKGFLVTCIDVHVSEILGLPVFGVEHFRPAGSVGVLLTVGRRFREEMEEELSRQGIFNYFPVDEGLLSEIEGVTSYLQDFPTNQYVNVLLYHRICEAEKDPWGIKVSPRHFEEQIRYISERYPVIGFGDDWTKVKTHSVVITFDDGCRDNLVNALPVLERYGVPATFFISTGNIGLEKEFWWDRLACLSGNRGEAADASLRERHAFLKKMRPEERGRRLEEMEGQTDPEKKSGYLLEDIMGCTMSEQEIQEFAKSAYVSIGAHTVTHASLSAETDEIQMWEITESKKSLERILGETVETFSYPYGDFNEKTISILRGLGFKKAATVAGGLAGTGDPFRISRNVVRDSDRESFEKWFRGLWSIFAEMRDETV